MVDFCPICGKVILPRNNIFKCTCGYYRNLNEFHIDNLNVPTPSECISDKNKNNYLNLVINQNKQFDKSKIVENSNEIINRGNEKFIKRMKPKISNRFRKELYSYERCLVDSDVEFLRNKYNIDCYKFFDEMDFKELVDKFNYKTIQNKAPDILEKFEKDLNSYEKCLDDSDVEFLRNKYNMDCYKFFDNLHFKEKIHEFNMGLIEKAKPHILEKFEKELSSYEKCLVDSDVEFLRNKYNMDYYNFFDELNFENLIDNFNNKLIDDISNDFNEFLDSKEDYIQDSEIESLKAKYNNICPNIFYKLNIKEKINEFNKNYCDKYKKKIKENLPDKYISNSDKLKFSNFNSKCDISTLFDEHNDQFIKNQIKNNKNLFDTLLDKNLSNDLIRAILTDDDNVKIIVCEQRETFIQAKIKYLIEECSVSPKDILYISTHNAFNISEKYSIKNHSFNSLSCEVLGRNINYKEIDDNELKVIIKSYFEKQITESPESMRDVVKFFLYFYHAAFYNELNNSCFQTIRSIFNDFDEEYEKQYTQYFQLDNVKEKKEYVNSIIELVIANYLYIHNISYEFSLNPLLESKEALFNYIEHDETLTYEEFALGIKCLTNDFSPKYICEKSSCYSNFYLPEYDIYIDLLNLNNYFKNNLSNSENKSSYIEEIDNFNKESETKIITILDEEVISILKNLEENLKKYSVNIQEVDYSALYESIILDNKLPEYEFFIKTMKQFIKSFKANTIYLDDNKKDISNLTIKEYLRENNKLYSKSLNLRNKFFLNVFKQIYKEYGLKLKKCGVLDNEDIINHMIVDLKNRVKIHDYKYIIVDEYQNMSFNKFGLLKEIQNKIGAKVIAIGNEWQPSFSYSGTDFDLFINFDKYFKNSKTVEILDANNNSQKFPDLIENIIQNENQLKSAENKIDNKIKLIGYISKAEEVLNLIKVFENINEEDNNGEILIIGRNSEDINEFLSENHFLTFEEDNNIKIVYEELPHLKIEYRTIHESKDLTRDYVIVLNVNNQLTSLPNKIENDLVLSFIRNNDENVSYINDRKLFYTTLTRAKKETYLFFNEIKPSIFIKEIEDLSYVERLNFSFSNNEIHKTYLDFNNKYDIIRTNNICPNCNSGNVNLIIDNINKSIKLKCSKFCGWDVEELRTKKCSWRCRDDMEELGMSQFDTYFLHKYVQQKVRENGSYLGDSIDVDVSEKIIDYKKYNKNYAIQLFTEELMNAITYLSYYKMDNKIKKIALIAIPSGDKFNGKSEKYKNFEGYRLARSIKLISKWHKMGITKSIFGLNKEIIDLKHSFKRTRYVGRSWMNRFNPIAHAESIKCEGIPEYKEDIAFIILDDVTTSGSSMIGCKHVLLDKGIDEDKIFTLAIGATVRDLNGNV